MAFTYLLMIVCSIKSSMTQKPGLSKSEAVYITFFWDFEVCFPKESSQCMGPCSTTKNLTVLPLWIHPKAFCALIENRIAPVPSDSPPQRWKVQDCQSPSLWNSFSCLKWDFSCFLKPDRRSRGDFFNTDPLTLVPINSRPTVLRSRTPNRKSSVACLWKKKNNNLCTSLKHLSVRVYVLLSLQRIHNDLFHVRLFP